MKISWEEGALEEDSWIMDTRSGSVHQDGDGARSGCSGPGMDPPLFRNLLSMTGD
jgi:hypothetical protein